MVITVDKAIYKGNYVIQLHFSDGLVRDLDFGPFLNKAKNPMTRKYLNKEEFKAFSIEHGDLVWNDYEMCFPIWDLHEGKI